MAKGNDGNFLQHAIETSLASRLVVLTPAKRLHVALTHGMAPFEPCDAAPSYQQQRLLIDAIQAANAEALPREHCLIAAYRTLSATLAHYPNSAELLRSLIGPTCLSGGVTEVGPAKYQQLAEAWEGLGVRVAHSSWRLQLGNTGVLACPPDLASPWLFSMDPMTFSTTEFTDDDKLYEEDLGRLSDSLAAYIASGRPGVAAIFVYSIRPEIRPHFWDFVERLAGSIGVPALSCWLPHQGGNKNLVGVLHSGFQPDLASFPAAIRLGRE